MNEKRLHEDVVLRVGRYQAKFHEGFTYLTNVAAMDVADEHGIELADYTAGEDVDDLMRLLEFVRLSGWVGGNTSGRAWGKHD